MNNCEGVFRAGDAVFNQAMTIASSLGEGARRIEKLRQTMAEREAEAKAKARVQKMRETLEDVLRSMS